ncbi:MAG TPA: hypothetical protein DHW82_11790, partial [Spirochaetia bacterium]|nr:hypothetical protein [Spirochaetia bacterium]
MKSVSLLKLLLLSLLALFTGIACSKNAGTGTTDSKSPCTGDCVAKIEDYILTKEEFNKAFDVLLKLNFTEGQGALLKDDVEFKKQALDNLIVQKLILKEIEKSKVIKDSFIEVFNLMAVRQYFIQEKVLPKVDIPGDDLITKKYNEFKKEFDKMGKNFDDAKKILVAEYQREKSAKIASEEMNKLKMKNKIFMNDEFETDGIKKYIEGSLKEADFSKTWLIKIYDKVYNASDLETFIRNTIEISYGPEGLKKYEGSEDMKKTLRYQMFNEYFSAVLVLKEASDEGWLNNEKMKDFLDIYIKNAKTELFVKYQLASKIEEPTEKELKAYYDSKKIKDPYNKVKA